MSKSAKDRQQISKPTSDKPSGVGYGRPPSHSRFQKGKSGNPGGRPKGSKNLRTLICELADEQVTLITPDGKKLATVREAAARKYLEMMLKGEFKFFQAFHLMEKEWETGLKLAEALEGQRAVEKMQKIIMEVFGAEAIGVSEDSSGADKKNME